MQCKNNNFIDSLFTLGIIKNNYYKHTHYGNQQHPTQILPLQQET